MSSPSAGAGANERTLYYFAYGSNMDPARFERRVGHPRSVRRAELPNHRLRFAANVQSEGGGGAVIDAAVESTVDGVLFEITEEQLAAMDREEFDPSRDTAGLGLRKRVHVETAEGVVAAEVYTITDDGRHAAPSPTYLAHIVDGLRAAGYGDDAVARVHAAADRAR
ncbi:MAG: gamma-glutamylcyclotransferase [Planctomycetes bacterium]|nr:gamma-glutamylcyclotransferase [Planctomycetota bacterium]MCB9917180.1 gamma-glutamylcyclotransferase [Planctomycetota bacterium]